MELEKLKLEYGNITDFGLERINFRGSRFYYRKHEYATNHFDTYIYPGVTSLLDKVLPKDPGLLKWFKSMDENEIRRYFKERELYGTLLHTKIAHLFKFGEIFTDELYAEIYNYLNDGKWWHLNIDLPKWEEEMTEDLLAFQQFVFDTNFKPSAVEVPFYSTKYKCATLIDLIGELDVEERGFFGEFYKSGVNKDQPKETKGVKRYQAILDIKSGRNTLTSLAHECQLKICQLMVEENYPDLNIEKLYNWHPKKFRTKPSYSLIDQTGKISAGFIERKVADYYEHHDPRGKKKLTFGGTIRLGEEPDAYQYKLIEDYL